MAGELLQNGIAPVNTCIDVKRHLVRAPQSTHGRSPTTYFNHDHRERKNVGFLAACPLLLQDLRCSPSWGVALLMRGPQHRIRVLSDLGEPKICKARMTGVAHEDAQLARCKMVVKQDLEHQRTPLRSP